MVKESDTAPMLSEQETRFHHPI